MSERHRARARSGTRAAEELGPMTRRRSAWAPSPACGPVCSKISQTLSGKFTLPWSHYVKLLALNESDKRDFYEEEARRGGWSVRQLDRQINSMRYERLALSRRKGELLRREIAAERSRPVARMLRVTAASEQRPRIECSRTEGDLRGKCNGNVRRAEAGELCVNSALQT